MPEIDVSRRLVAPGRRENLLSDCIFQIDLLGYRDPPGQVKCLRVTQLPPLLYIFCINLVKENVFV